MNTLKSLGIALLFVSLLLAGCGKKVHHTDEGPITDTDKTMAYANGYGFTKFDLKIDVSGDEDVKAKYEMKTRKILAEYINKAQKIKLKGDPAMEELHTIFTEIQLTKDVPQQEVIDKVLKAVGVNNYSKFKLKIDYDDGTKLKFEDEL